MTGGDRTSKQALEAEQQLAAYIKKMQDKGCAQCGSHRIIFESFAEGFWCPDCGSSDSGD